MRFQKRITLCSSHEYFEGRPCRDLQIVPTAACINLLKSRSILLKKNEVGSILLIAEEGTSVLDKRLLADSFSFLIIVTNKAFYHYTSFNLPLSGNTILFGNDKIEDGGILTATDEVKKPYTTIIPEGMLFGLVNIRLHRETAEFFIKLRASMAFWKYYVLTTSTNANLSIKDTSSAILFDQITNKDQLSIDPVYQKLMKVHSNLYVQVFQSRMEVPFLHSARKNIQLLNGDKGPLLQDNLPNPGLLDHGITIIQAAL